MGSLIHIAEIAALIFAAYMVGWFIGYMLHRIATRPTAATVAATTSGERATTQPQPDEPLVRAPVVLPVGNTAPPIQAKAMQIEPATAVAIPDGMASAEAATIPVPEAAAVPVSALETLKSLSTAMPLGSAGIAPVAALPEPSPSPMPPSEPTPSPGRAEPTDGGTSSAGFPALTPVSQPAGAVSAGEPAPRRDVPASMVIAGEPGDRPLLGEPAPVVVPEPLAVRELGVESERPALPKPPTEPEPVALEAAAEPESNALPAMPSNRPGVAWAGSIKGRESFAFERAAEVSSEPGAGSPQQEPAGLDIGVLDGLVDELHANEPALPVDQLDALAPSVTSAAAEPAPRRPHSEFDEDAAMRAIEGGWSRRATRAMSDARELTDVSAAVSAAQFAVEQVLAANGIDPDEEGARAHAAFGKPRGLPHPRGGRRDNLKQINGLGPLDESTLNNLGIYHFDQIAGWDLKEVLWMENHVFAHGRIGREDWQGQARALIDQDLTRQSGS